MRHRTAVGTPGGLRNDSTDAHRWAQLVYSRNAPLLDLLGFQIDPNSVSIIDTASKLDTA
jgi:hypothetical protein